LDPVPGNVYHSRLAKLLIQGRVPHPHPNPDAPARSSTAQTVREGSDATIALQRLDSWAQPSATIRWTDRLAPRLGPQKYTFRMQGAFALPAHGPGTGPGRVSLTPNEPPAGPSSASASLLSSLSSASATGPPLVWLLELPTAQAAAEFCRVFEETQSRWNRTQGHSHRRERRAEKERTLQQAQQASSGGGD
jgi:hypothetical protein